jgi:hypothetical protein
MEPLAVTADTAIVLDKQANSSSHYAVAPLIDNKAGVRSYGYDYTTQGVACYIRTFFGELVNGSAKLDLTLGTNYNIKTITWEKLTLNGYSPLQAVNSIVGLDFSYLDSAVTQGLNIYHVKLELLNGTIIYSEAITVYYTNGPYVIFPNPVPQYHDVTIISNNPDVAQLQIFNSTGMKISEQALNDLSNTVSMNKLGKGIYLIRIIQGGELKQTLKLIVY